MQIQVWVSILSLVGVVLGGGLSYLAQASVQRRSDRRDQRRQAAEQAEARRLEQLELLRQFIRVAQQAERAAEDRDNTPAWKATALDIVDELWVCERLIHILFASSLHELARAYLRALDHVLWQEPADVSLWDYLQGPKVAFLSAAREELSR
jgi:type II secretory pathway pseudopilin PulG